MWLKSRGSATTQQENEESIDFCTPAVRTVVVNSASAVSLFGRCLINSSVKKAKGVKSTAWGCVRLVNLRS